MEPHKHIELAPGAVANVAPDAAPETVDALRGMIELVRQNPRTCIRCGTGFRPDEPEHNTCADCAYGLYLSQF